MRIDDLHKYVARSWCVIYSQIIKKHFLSFKKSMFFLNISGCAVLKLSDGRKRSMSLWVEFITASGYLSARKIRSRFQTLVAQACDKSAYRDMLKMVADTSEVKLRIRDRFVVQITPAFKCSGVWPRSAAHWPLPHIPWPHPNLVVEVKTEGFDLLSKECLSLQVNTHEKIRLIFRTFCSTILNGFRILCF